VIRPQFDEAWPFSDVMSLSTLLFQVYLEILIITTSAVSVPRAQTN